MSNNEYSEFIEVNLKDCRSLFIESALGEITISESNGVVTLTLNGMIIQPQSEKTIKITTNKID